MKREAKNQALRAGLSGKVAPCKHDRSMQTLVDTRKSGFEGCPAKSLHPNTKLEGCSAKSLPNPPNPNPPTPQPPNRPTPNRYAIRRRQWGARETFFIFFMEVMLEMLDMQGMQPNNVQEQTQSSHPKFQDFQTQKIPEMSGMLGMQKTRVFFIFPRSKHQKQTLATPLKYPKNRLPKAR